ncbi:hypothetical protein Vi05172_g1759 [Venturia inaequalis]|nr:hypothetical protein Vi05172_g1759 [Venturia inaequalis]
MASNINGAIHHTGVFLSWHRYALSLWEDALRDECGWRGGLAYWDWHRDTPEAGADWLQSPLFDTVSGYGGNGQRVNASAPAGGIAVGGTGGGCVLDGPFQNRTLSIGPMGQMLLNNTRCLTRNFNVKVAYMSASSKSMRKILGAKSMAESRQLAESSVESRRAMSEGGNIDSFGSMHSIGHVGIGGEASSLTLMSDLFNSINDPLFFPHHAGLDRVWALWQEQDPKRIMDAGEATGLSDTSPMTLDSWFWVGFAGKDRQTVEVMDALNRDGRGVVCYKYEGNTFDSYFK